MTHGPGERGSQDQPDDLEAIARWAESSRQALDEALDAIGVDAEALDRVLDATRDTPAHAVRVPLRGIRV